MQSLYFPPGDNVWLSLVLKHHGESAVNKVYSLKYCPVTRGLIVVSELASRVIKKTCRRLTHILLAGIPAVYLYYPQISQAGIVRSDIAYQIYRDFAENKGLFVPGAT